MTLNPQIALLLILIGATLIYVEFLRPGWILPGTAGATLVIIAVAAFAQCPLRWPGMALTASAAACFLLAGLGRFQKPLIVLASATIAGAAIGADRLVGFSVGVPFAIVTGYLVNAAIEARRNKRESV